MGGRLSFESKAMLAEHQAPDTDESSPIGYEPTEDEAKAIKMVERLFSKAKKARAAYDNKWLDNYRMFRGKQWKESRPAFRHSEVINLIFRAIQSEVPIITDVMPKPQFVPTEPQDYELSQILNDLIDSDWTRFNWAYQLTEAIYDAHFYGTGFTGVDWDKNCDDGLGAIDFSSKDPFYQYPDPYALNVNQRSRYHIEAEPVPVDIIKQEYPEVAQYIKPDVTDLGKTDKEISDQIRFRSPTDNRTIVEGQSPFNMESRDEAVKITAWIRDFEQIEEEIENEDELGNVQKVFVKKLKYPDPRKIVVVNGVLCENTVIEYDDKKFPRIRLTNYILPREFWGMSEVEQLESPQKIFNKLISFALDVLTLMGNPIWVVDTTSGVDTDNLFNRPGLIVEKEPGSEVRREEGVQLQPYVLQMIDRMKSWFDDVSGNSEPSRGISTNGVTAASAIEALQSAANTRLRQKSKNLDAAMQEIGQMYLARVFQFYSAPRVFRVTNDQGAQKFFKFHVEDVQDPITNEIKKIGNVAEFYQGDDSKMYLGPYKQYDLQRKFDVKVSTGSVLPFEKSRIEQQSFKLYDMGIIDAEEVLNNLKYPNKEVVLKRLAMKQAAAPPPVPPPPMQ